MDLTPEEKKKQKQRNLALAVTLAAFVALVYVVTVVKLGANVVNRPL
jgi:thiol:disulfide interchange protein